jgi:uncharacterized membrane protein
VTEFIPQLEPLWPLLVILGAALVIVALTFWTYRGVQLAARRRVFVLLLLRLAALGVAFLVLLRPSWEYRETTHNPATIVILVDTSKSMLVADEDPQKTRWAVAMEELGGAADLIQRLEKEQQVQVIVHGFDGKLQNLSPTNMPAGDRTALVRALKESFDEHRPFDKTKGTALLGIVVMSDGRDNVGKPALDGVLAELARAPCPVYTIGLGAPGSIQLQADVIAQDIQAPSTARVKDQLLVMGTLQTHQLVNQEIEVWLKIDGKPAMQAENPTQPVRVVIKPQTAAQQHPIKFPACRLPDTPGDIRVSIWSKPVKDEITDSNNEVSTYMTLTKEGLSVLYFEKDRAWESKFIKLALKGDERITPTWTYLHTDKGDVADRWRREWIESIKNNVYDVFILGDIPASRFAPETREGRELLTLIRQKVEAGAGFLMIGGQESFGDGGWAGTPIEPLLPVKIDVKGQLEGAPGNQRELRFVPTEFGLKHFALRLDSDPKQNAEWWSRLATLNGGNKLNKKLGGAVVLAESTEGDVLLAAGEVGGRTAALAVDTTWRWSRPGPPHDPKNKDKKDALSEGREAHVRFWRQLILWLAKQEEAGKALRIELANRRIISGKEQVVTVQAREVTPGGTKDASKPLKGATFAVKIIRPDKSEIALPVQPDGTPEAKSQGTFWKTDEPGEYEVQVTATHQGADLGMARARFMTYRDDSELLNRTANHSLLEQIAHETGGTARLHGGLNEVLEKLAPESATEVTRSFKLPDWQEPNLLLQGVLFLFFVALVSCEWLLRRLWGLI